MRGLPTLLFLGAVALHAEQGVLVVHVKEVLGKPLRNIQLATEGDGSPGPLTDAAGKTRIRLAPQTKASTRVTLQVVKAPLDYVFISPWDQRVTVPSFENESENYVSVVLAKRGDRTMLESGDALKTLAANLSKAVPPKPTESRQDPLEEVAKQFGLPPEEIDKAIRAWGSRAEDPFEKGLAALYERNYPVATQRLEESLDQREKTLKQDQNAAADAAFFLGNALYDQGRYRDANARYQRAAELRPDDAAVLNNWGICLMTTAQYDKADQLLRRALVMAESSQGPDHPDTGTRLNLALLLEAKGDYAGAEPFLRRALAIAEKSHGPDHPTTGTTLNNLAVLLLARKGLRGRRTPLPPGPRDRGKVPRARPPRHRRVP